MSPSTKYYRYVKKGDTISYVRLNRDQLDHFVIFPLDVNYALNQVFCHKQSFLYSLFYLYRIGEIVNNQRIVCDRIPGV